MLIAVPMGTRFLCEQEQGLVDEPQQTGWSAPFLPSPACLGLLATIYGVGGEAGRALACFSSCSF